MNILQLGPLTPDPDVPEWLVSGPVKVSYLDGLELRFTLDGLGDEDAGDVRSAIAGFLALGSEARSLATPYVFQNYRRMVDAVGEDDDLGFRVASQDGIWTHVHPSEIFVSRRDRRDRLIYLQITAECNWEREHGLQIVYRRGIELSRVSDQDRHLTYANAYDAPEDQDRIA